MLRGCEVQGIVVATVVTAAVGGGGLGGGLEKKKKKKKQKVPLSGSRPRLFADDAKQRPRFLSQRLSTLNLLRKTCASSLQPWLLVTWTALHLEREKRTDSKWFLPKPTALSQQRGGAMMVVLMNHSGRLFGEA